MDKKSIKGKLEEKIQFLELVLDSANQGYWDYHILTGETFFSSVWYTMLGYDPYEMPSNFKTFELLLHPEDRKRTLKIIEDTITDGIDGYEVDFRMITKSGEYRWILSSGKVVERDNDGKPARMVGTHTDITRTKNTEERIKHLNSILLSIRDINQLIVTEKDKDKLLSKACKILSENRGFDLVWIGEIEKDSYNVIPKAHSGSDNAFWDLINVKWDNSQHGHGPTGKAIKTRKNNVVNDTNNEPRFKPWFDAIKEHGYNSAIAIPLITGEKVFGNLTLYSKRANAFDREEISLLDEVAADISLALHRMELEKERKEAEEKINKERQKLLEIIEFLPDATFVINEDKKVIAWNKALEEMTGVPKKKMLGKGNYEYSIPFYGVRRPLLVDLIFFEKKEIESKYKFVKRKENTLFAEVFVNNLFEGNGAHIFVKASPLYDSNGNLVGSIESVRDITEQKENEKKLQELLEKTQQFAEELQVSNEELQATTEELQVSNEELQSTTEELQVANEELRDQGNELMELNKALQQSEERFKALIYNSTDIIRIFDENGLIIFDSPSSTRILGYPEGYFIGKNPLDYIHPEDRERVQNDLEEVFKDNNPEIPTEFRIKKADGTYLSVESVAQNLMDVQGIEGVVATTHPIEERKKMEDDLINSIEEKSILLKEIHHRVKNNMQIISSLLSLQKNYVDDPEAVNVLKESQNRVKSMSMIHENLYQSKKFTKVNLSDYIKKLVLDLFYSYAIEESRAIHIIEVEDIMLNIETAVPCGLIISELVSNSLKYAFPTVSDRGPVNGKFTDPHDIVPTDDSYGGMGELKIILKQIVDNFELIVMDNGVGIPEDIDFKNTNSLGLQLVNNLVDQIDGEIELDRTRGTKFKITFKELIYKERF